jgi:hypothetical protein
MQFCTTKIFFGNQMENRTGMRDIYKSTKLWWVTQRYGDAKVTAVKEGMDLPVRNEEITNWKHPWPAVEECHIRVAM